MLFQFDNYKDFLREWIEKQPSKGRGEIAKLGQFLNISPSLVSTILNSDRHFSVEQACELCEYFKLDRLECDYFIALVSFEKAGSEKLKKFWTHQKREILKRSKQVEARIKFEKNLTPEQQTQYYSHAVFSQIRVLSTLEVGISKAELESFIKLPSARLNDALDFLLEAQLISEKAGRYTATDKIVHVNKESPHFLRHHMNWRLLQLQQVSSTSDEDVTYTFPCTLNKEDFKKIKTLLVEAITKSHQIVRASPAESFACLTIDFISYFSKS